MPWDSFRKKRLSASSPSSKKKDHSPRQQQADRNQHSNEPSCSSNTVVNPVSPTVNDKTVGNHHPAPPPPPPPPPQPTTSKADGAANSGSRTTAGLPQEIYQKIKEVDQEPSTLTAGGVEGLSARVQEKYEFTQPSQDGSIQTYICQTVELIKRPGQSLGLYLREGNGIDRADGVFVSRLADGFDLQKSGVLNTGDEILSVNDVNVTRTSIDEVVVMISIPRRLVLRTRTVKGHAAAMMMAAAAAEYGGGLDGKMGNDSNATNKPIAVLKQLPREESRESSLTDDGTPLVSSQLIATAQTSLGVKARQQESAMLSTDSGTGTSVSTTASSSIQSSQQTATMPLSQQQQQQQHLTSPRQHQQLMPQRSLSDRWSYNRQLAMHTPKVLDAEGRLMNNPAGAAANMDMEAPSEIGLRDSWGGNGTPSFDPRTMGYGGGGGPSTSMIGMGGTLSHAAQGMYLRSQRLQSHYQTLERATAAPFNSTAATSSSFTAFPGHHHGGAPSWNSSFVPEPAESVPHRSLSGYGVSNAMTPARSALRQPSSALKSTNSADGGGGGATSSSSSFPNVKSNSLPRRQPGRTIKWRSDYPPHGGEPTGAGAMMNPNAAAALCYSSDMSDSDGAVSAPEFPMSPPNRVGVPQPVYPLPRAGGKTVDDIFSRAEYQAWTRSSALNGGIGGGGGGRANPGQQQQRYDRYTSHYGHVIPISAQQQHFPTTTAEHAHRSQQRHHYVGQSPLISGNGDHQAQTSRGYDSASSYFGTSTAGLSSSTHWSQSRSATADDDDSSSSSVVYGGGSGGGGRPVPPPRSSRTVKSRSSSLPPRGILNRAVGRATNGTNGGIYEPTSNGNGHHQHHHAMSGGTARNGSYALDVSPLPHRRLPLALAAATPGFGYTADGPMETHNNTSAVISSTGGDGSTVAALTGILVIRILEGRGLRSRDQEELYCVLEVDGEHRARTEVSDWHVGFRWEETFEIDVWDCRQTDFYVYSWHPQYRHKLRHHASLQLVDALLNMTKFDLDDEDASPSPTAHKQASSNHSLALTLDPRGQLFVQIGFRPMSSAYRRMLATRRAAYFGTGLQILTERESTNTTATGVPGGGGVGSNAAPVPAILRRIIQEIERRGVDTGGLYTLCGSIEKKKILREALERDPCSADISADSVPDLNILTSVLKDFLRELPEPLVPHSTFQMLLEAWKVCVVSEKEGNSRLLLGVIDCLPKANKCAFMMLMDHFKHVISQSPHNGLSATKCGVIFGPLIFCTSQAYSMGANGGGGGFATLKSYFSFLDHRLAARLLEVILEYWPSHKSHSTESTGSDSSTLSLTSNGARPLTEVAPEPRMQESNC